MKKLIKPSHLKGILSAPSSKSMMQRAVAAAILSNGTTVITNASFCNDSLAALSIAKSLGAEVKIFRSETKVEIRGGFKPKSSSLNCGESGLSIRMFSPIAALHNDFLSLEGHGSLKNRSMEMVENALKQFGVDCQTQNSFVPLRIKGPLLASQATIDGSISSQLLTGLLFALPLTKAESRLKVINLKSKPYIDMTINLLSKFGVSIENRNYDEFVIQGNQSYTACNYTVEGDWSNLAFWLVGGAINGDITLNYVNFDSKQADMEILQALKLARANFEIKKSSIQIQKSNLSGFDFDATDCPDLFPPLVALAVNANSVSHIKGVSRLTHKESNRALALKIEFEKLGASISHTDDAMTITPGKLHGASTSSHNDHRMAMALSIAGLSLTDDLIIEEAESVAKSYPEFYDDYTILGGICTTI
jgi:3-phosphoshikimate 1-carboxyvinyltransferase